MDPQEQTRALDVCIAELAERQHGVVARRQLLALEVSTDAIKVRLRAGRLHHLHRGVYAVGHRVLSREAKWMGAALFCGPRAVLSHRSAAALWGLRPYSGAIEVTAPSKTRSRRSIRRHFAVLPADEVTERDRIPVTTVPRTIFDLAAMEPINRVEQALRQQERLRHYDALSLVDLLDRDRRLLAAGYRGPRVTWRHLDEIPEEVAADLNRILDNGSPA